jgi:hypothetical protein
VSEENTNTTIPAMLSPGEPLISEDTAKKFQAFADEILSNNPEESEDVVEAVEPEEKLAEEVKPEEEPAPEADANVILAEEPVEELPAITHVENGVIGTGTVKKKSTAKKTEPKVEGEDPGNTLAVYSLKNLHWPGVGSLLRGYSVIPAKTAEKWVSRNKNVRLATPEEVAEEFGK